MASASASGGFAHHLLCGTPKGDEDDDVIEMIRNAEDTRSLGLKNSDYKTICAAVNWSIKGVIARGAHQAQRGFLPGRQLAQNVVDLDALGRIHGYAHDASDSNATPMLPLLDITAAFPSVSHPWLRATVRHAHAPRGLIAFIEATYAADCALFPRDGGFAVLYAVAAGLAQGCPLSGTLFVWLFDPFIRAAAVRLERADEGEIRASADDVGGSLKTLSGLSIMHSVFVSAEGLANLCVHPRKCVLVPTGAALTEQFEARIRQWLAANIPEWQRMRIAD